MKYSDQIADWLKVCGYTHCFYLSGGNIMHLLNSFRKKLKCIPVLHEVAGGIAAEYFNETSNKKSKAVALVTAGPGLTNIVTAIGGAFLEGRELLVIGGQVKKSDISNNTVIQKGIQEIDGEQIAKPITKLSKRLNSPIDFDKFHSMINFKSKKQGPVFIEIPLDVQGASTNYKIKKKYILKKKSNIKLANVNNVAEIIKNSMRPSILIGAGVDREVSKRLLPKLKKLKIPLFTTYNGADRIPSNFTNYFGRPNTWGKRYSNIFIQQSDVLLVLGSRLGLQQTGFNWKEFIPKGKIIQVDTDIRELKKGHPKIYKGYQNDANDFLQNLLRYNLGNHSEWINYGKKIKKYFPLNDKKNKKSKKYMSPYIFYEKLSKVSKSGEIIIPCSSGGAFTTFYQTFLNKKNQKIISNKSLASMGYGLSGAIGACFANPRKKVIHIEGDGGFTQNLQEIGTVSCNKLNLKSFIFDDYGYASIRMTQRNYFGGVYMGCDKDTLLGIPSWNKIFSAWNVKTYQINNDFDKDPKFFKLFENKDPVFFIVPINPEQTYFPKISSKITSKGSMESNPLHHMTPDLTESEIKQFLKYI